MHAFISYAHADQKHLDRLHAHMAMLIRDGVIEAWSDHLIAPGAQLGAEIDRSLERSGLFIALVSPDYLFSKYCYEREFTRALELAAGDRLRIVPVIVEPCEWLSSPLSKFLAVPKDGKAISEWTNANVAYLDAVKGIRRAAEDPGASQRPSTGPASDDRPTSSSVLRRIKVRQEFDTIQRRDFADEAFTAIRDYFRRSCEEINGVEDLKARFEPMTDHAFTCTVVNRGLMRGRGEGHITVRNDKGRHHFGDISYVYQSHAEPGTSNGSVQVEADEYNLYLTMDRLFGRDGHKYDARQVAEALWTDFVGQAGIEIGD